ncbi:hypothetical protein EVAR_87080_1 [Eumeta japonica]|uniref:Uncharacterized protein n=1 Tax=Eumeta variegata TaxID=151549 RepID=A0A4C1VNY9_EUMVA|nr:hypothetical protein EVAR_87080_1 [Eumeta japonica]
MTTARPSAFVTQTNTALPVPAARATDLREENYANKGRSNTCDDAQAQLIPTPPSSPPMFLIYPIASLSVTNFAAAKIHVFYCTCSSPDRYINRIHFYGDQFQTTLLPSRAPGYIFSI